MDYDNTGMYDTDDYEPPAKISNAINVESISKGTVTEIDINGTKVEVVSPAYVRDIQKAMLELSIKLRDVDRNMQAMSQTIRQQNRTISDLRLKLENKIDRI